MTRDDIIRMARKVGLGGLGAREGFVFYQSGETGLKRFAALVAAAEREECAKVCDDRATEYEPGRWGAYQGEYMEACECADAIRARGEK